ncbi:hypothetical protein TVAG_146080 [Trichomonas vaginalis G3]|uniref:Sulfatase N-terminal domain-containing protein n=1 Tax=Trichomonas vaginalis (strain ATCC PRA-98 / G3) TaxID=412133 RepID=A2F8B1_TRIV3|nr:lipoteichoic acid synthase family [Trichomonas vaginalis G3]EAX98871.1 hypothetical protein TVAG_146080 [Trichomonas vaginalis G3]KAI5540551.1 lipoteichoic acid synthase family [Trichomonas vaginalis G3]|eukprot:XP_001311801.1 hypothetical protein [Trichomonas vaginalis G3]
MLESMESTLVSLKNGGDFDESKIPELEKLALDKENVQFSHHSKIGGAIPVEGMRHSYSANFAVHCGLPFFNFESNQNNLGKYYPGAYCLGDILKDNGYENVFVMGENPFKNKYVNIFRDHGNFTLKGYDFDINNKELYDPETYIIYDMYLYQYAKEFLKNNNNFPFFLQLNTYDTHLLKSKCKLCDPIRNPGKYMVDACASRQVDDFVNFVKNQHFYHNTTIFIVGDHLKMLEQPKLRYAERSTYDVFINSRKKPINMKNRQFTTFDYYPTILTAIGAEYKGNAAGIGRDLFSKAKTVSEQIGFDNLRSKIKHQSKWYEANIAHASSDDEINIQCELEWTEEPYDFSCL